MNDVLAIVMQALSVEGQVVFQLVGEPIRATLDACMEVAKTVNENKEVPHIVMCMPTPTELGIPT